MSIFGFKIKWSWILLFPLFFMGCGKEIQDDLPNIVIILADDMGYGDLGSYNVRSKIPTPYINQLVQEGMRFTDAHAAGALCHPSRYGLLTGRYPFRTNVNKWRSEPLIKEGQTTMASLLKEQGYNTHMVGKWHLGFKEDTTLEVVDRYRQPLRGGPTDHGFDTFWGVRASTDIPPYFYIRGRKAVSMPVDSIEANRTSGWSPIQGAFWREGNIASDLELIEVLPRLTEEAIHIITRHSEGEEEQPFFLYVALSAPHAPWLPTTELAENTLVIVTSDNGPVWHDENVKQFGHDSAGGLRGMKADAWEAGHRVPFVIRWPGNVKAGSVSDQLISFVDLLPTFADLVNVVPTTITNVDGVSFLPLLLGDKASDVLLNRTLVIPACEGAMSIRSGPWKLVNSRGSGGFSWPRHVISKRVDTTGQLYNLIEDPTESRNLYLHRQGIVKKVQNRPQEITGAGSLKS